MATIDGGTGFQFPLSMSTEGAELTVYEEKLENVAMTQYTVVGTTPKIPHKQYSAKVTASQLEMALHKFDQKGYLEHVLEGVKKQVLEQMNQDICFLGLTSSKTGSAHDPVTGEGYSGGVVSTQWDLMNLLSSEPFYTPPLISSWPQVPAWVCETFPNEQELFWKLSAAAGEHPSGSSKPKVTRKDTFKNGIL